MGGYSKSRRVSTAPLGISGQNQKAEKVVKACNESRRASTCDLRFSATKTKRSGIFQTNDEDVVQVQVTYVKKMSACETSMARARMAGPIKFVPVSISGPHPKYATTAASASPNLQFLYLIGCIFSGHASPSPLQRNHVCRRRALP